MRKIATLILLLCAATVSALAADAIKAPVVKNPMTLKAQISRLGEDAAAPISERPAGEYSDHYSRSANYWMPSDDDMTWMSFYNNMIGELVVDGNTVYVRKPIINMIAETWIRGDIDGETVTVTTPQAMFEYSDSDTTMMLYLVKMIYEETTDDEGNITDIAFYIDEEDPTVQFTWRDGSLVQVGDDKLALCDGDGGWWGYCEDSQEFIKIDAPILTDDDLTMEDYVLRYVKKSQYQYVDIKGCVDDGKMYLGELAPGLPHSVIAGTIDGDQVTFASGQYLGPDTTVYRQMFFTGATYDYDNYEYVGTDALVMTFDATGDTLSSPDYFVINPVTNSIYKTWRYQNPTIFKYGEPTDDLQDPEFVKYYGFDTDEGYGEFKFWIPLESANGQYFKSDNIYYNIYIDDDMLTLTSDEYTYVPQSMTDVPYAYDDDYDVSVTTSGHRFCYYKEDAQKLGVRVKYVSGDVIKWSNIVWYDIATGEVSKSTAISEVVDNTGSPVVAVEYYDLTGHRLTQPTSGICLKRVIRANGTSHTVKMLVK